MKFRRRSSIGSIPSSRGERVHRPLDRVGRLRPAGAAVGVGRRRVREDARALEAVGRDVVAARVDPGAEQRDPRRDELQVGAHRRDEPDADGGDRPLRGGRELDLLEDVAAVDRRVEPLRALLDPLHRPVQAPREREAERLLGVDVELRAEAAADVRRDHAQPRLGMPTTPASVSRAMCGIWVDVHSVSSPVPGSSWASGAARLHRHRDQPLLAVAAA